MIFSNKFSKIEIQTETGFGDTVPLLHCGKEYDATLLDFMHFADGSWAAQVSIPRRGLWRLLGPKTLWLWG